MPKFRFQLEPVLRQRLAVERQKQVALAGVERERLAIEARIQEGHERFAREREELRSILGPRDATISSGDPNPVSLRAASWQASASLAVLAETQRLTVALEKVNARLAAARRDLADAMTRRKAVELLKERRLEEFRAAQSRAENASLDELAVMRAGATGVLP
ncbi:MAG: flagellar FliJ family protein [Phycisphaerales bacterium]|nr:MAG: flagellar FliJ family protein [Phycisphaerales bacterium]